MQGALATSGSHRFEIGPNGEQGAGDANLNKGGRAAVTDILCPASRSLTKQTCFHIQDSSSRRMAEISLPTSRKMRMINQDRLAYLPGVTTAVREFT